MKQKALPGIPIHPLSPLVLCPRLQGALEAVLKRRCEVCVADSSFRFVHHAHLCKAWVTGRTRRLAAAVVHHDAAPVGISFKEKLVVDTLANFTAPHHDCHCSKTQIVAVSSQLPLCPLLPFSRFLIRMMAFVWPFFVVGVFFAHKEAA